MPLVRRPSPPFEPSAAAPVSLTEGTSDQRWAAVRAAATRPDGVALLAAALPQERDPRVLEAIFTALARVATAESAAAVAPFIRSDDASLRAAALDALRAMPEASRPHVARLLADPDPDVRLLSALIDGEAEKNVVAAAVEVLAEVGRPEVLAALARCAERFAGDPFLAFSIKVATDRIGEP